MTAETTTATDGELAATVDETELVLRWMEKPGTRLVDLTGTLACPAPGTGAFNPSACRKTRKLQTRSFRLEASNPNETLREK